MDRINYDYSITSTSITILATSATVNGQVTTTWFVHRQKFMEALPTFATDTELDTFLSEWYERLNHCFRRSTQNDL